MLCLIIQGHIAVNICVAASFVQAQSLEICNLISVRLRWCILICDEVSFPPVPGEDDSHTSHAVRIFTMLWKATKKKNSVQMCHSPVRTNRAFRLS